MRDIEVSGAGAVGIYLEAGSKDNVIEDSRIHHNGFGNVTPEGVPITVGGTELRYESTGREGIAIDGSRNNIVRDNWIAANSAGAIFLYKNCGENATTNPDGHWVRHYGATGNLITEQPHQRGAERGVDRIPGRGEPVLHGLQRHPVHRRDRPARLSRSRVGEHGPRQQLPVRGLRASASRMTARPSTTTTSSSNSAAHQAVLVGTKERTGVLAQPVTGTVVTGNRASIAGNPTPYSWIWGHTATTFTANLSAGAPVALAEGVQPTINPFLFAKRIWAP